jgi:hypothetical protein
MPCLANSKREAFAILISTGAETVTNAYTKAGYTAKNLNVAKASSNFLLQKPEIQARIAELKAMYVEKMSEQKVDEQVQSQVTSYLTRIHDAVDESLRTREGRLRQLCARHALLCKVIEERAIFKDHRDVPGGTTGLVVTSRKMLNKDRTMKTHEIDLKLMVELREIEKQIAIETGQWIEKKDERHMVVTPADIPDSVLEEMVARGKALQAGPVVDVKAVKQDLDAQPKKPDHDEEP